jgi:hypothetical protein
VTGLRAGGEIDAMCTKCKMILAHTILALEGGKPARVECNTCRGQHNYRSPAGESKAASPRAAGTTRSAEPRESSSRTRVSFDDQLAAKSGFARPYSPKSKFSVDDTVSHPTFGTGFVVIVRQDKIDVTFRAGTKTLVHARG